MRSPLVAVTKALIVVLCATVVACQVWMVPMIAAGFATTAPEFAHLETPGIVLVGALLACGEVVLVSVWRLLTFVSRDSVFDAHSFRWVDAIIAAVAAAGVIVVVGMTVIGDAQAGSPFLALTGTIALVTIVGLALVVLVMRRLLRQATALRQEMAEVV
ncbi:MULTISPECIES: DUF2975 domain-containing protein [unclassified Microbacterium]|uniref:DUF2975 domain-containing protein n=1 Tax=unclassified Microbacterium TaxID=2609290 RepID=UPI00214BB383|nr:MULTISPECIES: DUF2975 domain-containing protein [unclassified Microbacterium]MCR2783658.1 DUF2975 domain-containing protein [Microbacterium sp. zg.B96]WIM15484.1 DUF2975 domain-containing protein [Microbacterium sp. zg-B96]